MSSHLWKVELANDEVEYIAEEISKQSIEGVAWFFLTSYSKMQGRDKLKKEFLSKKKPELGNSENSQPIHIGKKMRKLVLKRTPADVVLYHLIKRSPWYNS